MSVAVRTKTVAPVANEDRRFRRAQLGSVRRKGRTRVSWAAVRVAVKLLVLGFVVAGAVRYVLVSPRFHVNHIVVRGNARLAREDVLSLVRGLEGQHVFAVNLEEWRTRVLASPWLADARLHRRLPSTMEIVVVEREPLALSRTGGKLFLIDDTGRTIDAYGPEYAGIDLPIVDGLDVPGDATAVRTRADLVGRLLRALSSRQELLGQLAQIDVHDERNAIVMLERDSTRVQLGDTQFLERLQSYLELAPALRTRVADIDYVDVRFEPRVFVRPSNPGAAIIKATAAPLP